MGDSNLDAAPSPALIDQTTSELFRGLQAIADDQFPRTCSTCGQVFQGPADLLGAGTSAPDGRSGLRPGEDDQGRRVVYLFRNCRCGSTLLESFKDRRDQSPAGQRRRKKFGELLELLARAGVKPERGRIELLKLLAGERSEYLEGLNIHIRPRQV
jgi:hypothetical protein